MILVVCVTVTGSLNKELPSMLVEPVTDPATNRANLQAALDSGESIELVHRGYYPIGTTGLTKPAETDLVLRGNGSCIKFDSATGLNAPADGPAMNNNIEVRDLIVRGKGSQFWQTGMRFENACGSYLENVWFDDTLVGQAYMNVQSPGATEPDGYSEKNISSRCRGIDCGIPLYFGVAGGKNSFARHRHRDWDVWKCAIGVWGTAGANVYEHIYEGWTHLVGGVDNAITARFDSKVRGLRWESSTENVNADGADPTVVLFGPTAEEVWTADLDITTTHRGWAVGDAENSRAYSGWVVNLSADERQPRWRVVSLHIDEATDGYVGNNRSYYDYIHVGDVTPNP